MSVYTHGRRYPVKESRHDDERLSELLDGRLEGPEREELLAYLATAGEDYEVFTEAAAVLLEAEQAAARESAPGAVEPTQRPEAVPPSTKSRGRWLRPGARRLIAFTAALAGLVLLWILVPHGGRGPSASPVALAMSLEGSRPLPAGWERRPLSTPVRGEGDDEWTPGRAATAGAYLVRLAVAIKTGDAEATQRLARLIQQEFDRQGGSALDTIAARPDGAPAELNRLLQRETERLEEFGNAGHLRVGTWIEAGQIAALQQDAAFFRTAQARDMLDRAEALSGGDAAARQSIDAVRSVAEGAAPPRWNELSGHLTLIFRAIAG